MSRVARLIKDLALNPHPEGGFYAETYRSEGLIPASALPAAYGGPRPYATSILFLLPAGSVSHLHRLRSDEQWFHHEGGPLVVVEIAEDGSAAETVLGPGGRPQHTVRAGAWFGAYPQEGAEYALVGCAVAPGFDFADFELAARSLADRFPERRALIERLTPS